MNNMIDYPTMIKRQINGRQIEALHALLHGASYAEASEKAGVSEEKLLDWMKYNIGLFRDIRDFRGNFKLPPLEWVRENLEHND